MAGPTPYCIPTTEIIAPTGTIVSIGDIVTGPGFQSGTTVVAIGTNSYNQVVITLNQPPWTGSIVPAGVDGDPCDASVPTDWFSKINFTDPQQIEKTISFSEQTKGWVSFKSFTPENAISVANDYYTFNNAKLFKHHVEDVDRNTFYEGEVDFPFIASSFNVILNNAPGSIKSFNTLNYEGSQSKVDIDLDDNQYFNLIAKPGWYVESIETDLEKGSLNEFIDKEGKWFNYLKGQNVITDNNGLIVVNPDGSSSFDQSSFAIQGIGVASSIFCPNCPEITSWNCEEVGGCSNPIHPCCYDLTDTGVMGTGWDQFSYFSTTAPTSTFSDYYYEALDGSSGDCIGPNGGILYSIYSVVINDANYNVLVPGSGPGEITNATDLVAWMNANGGGGYTLGMTLMQISTLYSAYLNVTGLNYVGLSGISCDCDGVFSLGGCVEVIGTGGEYQTELECKDNCRGNGNGGSLSCYQCYDGNVVTSTTNAVHVGDGWACPQGWTTTIPNCGTNVMGCTDPLAANFFAGATIDDGSCIYDSVPATCGNIFTSGALEGCDDFLCLLYPGADPTCSGQAFPNAMALATYWATEITNAANGIYSSNTPQTGYVDQNGATIGAITAQDMYDLLVSCCDTPVE